MQVDGAVRIRLLVRKGGMLHFSLVIYIQAGRSFFGPITQSLHKLTIMFDVIVNEYAQGIKSMTPETRQFD